MQRNMARTANTVQINGTPQGIFLPNRQSCKKQPVTQSLEADHGYTVTDRKDDLTRARRNEISCNNPNGDHENAYGRLASACLDLTYRGFEAISHKDCGGREHGVWDLLGAVFSSGDCSKMSLRWS